MTAVMPSAELVHQSIDLESDLQERFSLDHQADLCESYLQNMSGEIPDDKRYVITLIQGDDPIYGDIGKSVECTVFSKAFKRTLSDVYLDYVDYDSASTFIVAIDRNHPKTGRARPAGAIRLINDSPQGLKSIKDMIKDDPSNPWRDEIANLVFSDDEQYSPDLAWKRLCDKAGVVLDPSASVDVATFSVHPAYGRRNRLSGVYVSLYHTCLRLAMAQGKKNLVSIQDLPPLELVQEFGKPFDTFDGLSPRPYGGPYDTLPAYCILDEGMARVRSFQPMIGKLLIEGVGLDEDTYQIKDRLPNLYGNVTVGLESE
ncbi:MAG TPA: hypothetical protein VFN56_00990 [Candidatus Saccharimonadales bacterium]|nr:hypothetical protein [Candidatus Saccharimonadales bacterium]